MRIKKAVTFVACICLLAMFSACGGAVQPETAGLAEKDLEFQTGGKVFTLNSDVKALLKELGDEYEFSEAPSCVYEGTDKVYEYPGVSIYTYPIEGKDYIDEIVLTDDNYKTNKDIYVGSSLEELIAAYGDSYKDEGGMIRYSLELENLKSPCLYFILEEGKVTSISYYSASNIID